MAAQWVVKIEGIKYRIFEQSILPGDDKLYWFKRRMSKGDAARLHKLIKTGWTREAILREMGIKLKRGKKAMPWTQKMRAGRDGVNAPEVDPEKRLLLI